MRGYARNLDHLRIHHVDSASSLKLQIYTILRDGAVGISNFHKVVLGYLSRDVAGRIVSYGNGHLVKNVQEMRKRARVIIDTRSLNSQQDAFSMPCYLDNLQDVWHLTGVLRDGAIPNMTQKNLDLVVNTKMQCIYLDQALEALQLEPQYFFMFSSVSNRFGNFGQTNYAYGNSICAVNEGLSEPLPIADCLEHMHFMLTS